MSEGKHSNGHQAGIEKPQHTLPLSQTSKVPPSIPPPSQRTGPDKPQSVVIKPYLGLLLGLGWHKRGCLLFWGASELTFLTLRRISRRPDVRLLEQRNREGEPESVIAEAVAISRSISMILYIHACIYVYMCRCIEVYSLQPYLYPYLCLYLYP